METIEELNAKIMKITMVIQADYPELSKYLNEMPVTIPNQKEPEIDQKNLQKYYDSLIELFRNYVAEHQLVYIKNKSNENHL